jgi:hypothetical protein
MSMRTIDVQCRQPGSHADALLDGLQRALGAEEPAGWNESGHARITLGRERDDARELVAAHLDRLDTDWREHITIL